MKNVIDNFFIKNKFSIKMENSKFLNHLKLYGIVNLDAFEEELLLKSGLDSVYMWLSKTVDEMVDLLK